MITNLECALGVHYGCSLSEVLHEKVEAMFIVKDGCLTLMFHIRSDSDSRLGLEIILVQ